MHLIRDLGANLTDSFINKLKKKTPESFGFAALRCPLQAGPTAALE